MREITDLARKAAGQHGLLTHADLLEIGITTRQRSTLVDKGVLTRERRGLFVLAGAPPTWEQQAMRACLGAAGRGVASHRTAMRLWNLRPWETAIEVSVRGIAAPSVEGAVVHRSYDLVAGDVRRVDGIRVTSVARTIVDAGSYLGDGAVERAVDAAIGTGLTTAASLQEFRNRVGRHGRTGVTAVDRVLGDAPEQIDAGESPMEIALLRLIERHSLPTPVAQLTVEVSGRRFRADFAYPDARVLIEYDGYREHIDPVQFARDRWRQNLLVLDGWVVLRFTKADLRERPVWVVTQIRDALRRANDLR